MTHRRLLPLLLLLVAGHLLAGEKPLGDLLREADHLKGRGGEEQAALDLCAGVIGHKDATREQKAKAYDIILYVHRRRRKRELVVQVLGEMRQTFAGDKELEQKALSELIREFWEWNKLDEGHKRIDALIALPPDGKPALADAWAWKCRYLNRQGKHDEAFAAGSKIAEVVPDDAKRISDILWLVAESAWAKARLEDCERALRRLLEPKYLEHRNEWEVVNARRRLGETLERLKRYADTHTHYVACEKVEKQVATAQDWCLRAARAQIAEQKYDEALKTCERVFTAHGTVTNSWYSAQITIMDVLRRQGKLDEAIRAARVALDASPSRNEITNVVRAIAEMVKQKDKHVGRANQIINYQRLGPGEGRENPLPGFGYPSYPERERAFANFRKEAGDDAQAARFRAYTYIYSAKPKKALSHFLDAFSRATGNEFKTLGAELMVVGVRAARGYAGDVQPFVDFINHGPAGPDGKTGTADDLKDPFAPLTE